MPTLHLGVVDQPYVQRGSGRGKRKASTVSTGDVAEWLENRYHILENFVQMHEADIAADLEASMSGALENLLLGGPIGDFLGSATSKIEDRMKQFLSLSEMETIGYPGVPTQAALKGINHRKKRPRTGTRRPSFIDTGLYQASLKAWAD
jgi:hypothetical protein